jgi:formamidopyrimidine-DNA glycosylase
MPELPDLQVISSNLDKQFSGKKIETVTLRNPKRTKTKAAEFKRTLEGQKLKTIYREGKELRFQCENGNVLGVHLMLHGAFAAFQDNAGQKHTILEIHFADDSGLALTDYQGMATPSVNPPEPEAPDALSKTVNARFLKEQLSATRSRIKNVLVNQHIIRGIGNAYADEILWDARISPFSISDKIPQDKVKDLAHSIHKVLTHAEKQIRKEHPGLISGEIRDFLLIHHPQKEKSPTGAPIETKKTGGGKTYYTKEQQLFS